MNVQLISKHVIVQNTLAQQFGVAVAVRKVLMQVSTSKKSQGKNSKKNAVRVGHCSLSPATARINIRFSADELICDCCSQEPL